MRTTAACLFALLLGWRWMANTGNTQAQSTHLNQSKYQNEPCLLHRCCRQSWCRKQNIFKWYIYLVLAGSATYRHVAVYFRTGLWRRSRQKSATRWVARGIFPFYFLVYQWFARLELLFLEFAVENCPLGLEGVVLGLKCDHIKI